MVFYIYSLSVKYVFVNLVALLEPVLIIVFVHGNMIFILGN